MSRRSGSQIATLALKCLLGRGVQQSTPQPAAGIAALLDTPAARPAASLAAWFAASGLAPSGARPAASLALRLAAGRAQGAASSAAAAASRHQASRGARFMTFPPRGGGGGGGGWRHPDPSRVVWGLIAANGAVWMLWRVDPMTAQRHFVVSLDSLRDGRLWTAATAAFSQESFTHLASNMISLFFFGRGVGQLFGGRPLLLLYLAGGVAGSLAHVGWTHHKERRAGLAGRPAWMRGPARGALGASAAVNAVVLTDVLLFPTRTVLLYGLIPMPAALLGALWLWHDLGGALGGGDGPVAHAGHLGGAATGLAFWLAFKRGLVRPQRWW